MPLMRAEHLPVERCATDRMRLSLPVTVERASARLSVDLGYRESERVLDLVPSPGPRRGQFLDMKSGQQTR